MFRAPEYRGFTLASLSPADLKPEAEIPEDTLRSAYEERKDEFHVPEQRQIEQILAPTEEKAKGKRKPRPPGEAMADARIKHREYRDDRFVVAAQLNGYLDLYYLVRVVTPGNFVVPPSFAEDMYRPELRGLSAGSGTLKVEERK